MIAPSNKVLTFKISVFLAIVAIAGMLAASGLFPGSRARGATSLASPRVTSIAQITHDGFRKTNLLADDSQLFVTESPAANRVIAKVALPSSDRSLVPSPFSNLKALDLSPDHSKLLVAPMQAGSSGVSSYDEFWTLPVAAGSAQRVGDLTGRDAAWSADGQHLVFSKGSLLLVAGASGTQPQVVFTANGSVFAPHFSPDGQRIRFTVSDAAQNSTSLWEVNQDGSSPHPLLADWQYASSACCGNWTADGRYYIFQAQQSVPNTALVVTALWATPDSAGTNSQPSALVQLTSGPMSFGNVSLPRGSNSRDTNGDNKNLWAIGVQPRGEVVKYDRRSKKFIPVIAGVSATDLAFSPDGKWVTYVAIPEGTLWRSRANGSDRLQLTSAPDRCALPVWSPDGKQIAYVSMSSGQSWKLYLIPSAGGTPQEVVNGSGGQIDANWSADGNRLMFGDFRQAAGGLSIRILDFKTRKIETVPGSNGLFSPRWSPDGRYIAAISPDNTTLKLFDFQTRKWSNWLVETAGTVSYPVWSKDSQYIYFDDLVNGDESIRRVKVGENQPELSVVLGTIDRYPGALGPWIGRAVDGSWMFVRDRSTQEVYQLSMELP
jgi:Tol biopolymer transport system component